jgi:hypothetical protein
MDENWYSAEQEIRDRISQARAAARVQSMLEELATPAPRRESIAAALRRWATWIVEASRGGAKKSTTPPTLHPSERRTP